MAIPPDPRHRRDLEAEIGRLLSLGTAVAVVFLLLGVVLMVARGVTPLTAGDAPLAVDRLVSGIAGLRPEGYVWLGLLAVVATPTARVLAALIGFARRGEGAMVAIAAAVLAVVALSVLLGAAGG